MCHRIIGGKKSQSWAAIDCLLSGLSLHWDLTHMWPLGLDYPINTRHVAVGITHWDGTYDNTFLCICILCILFVFLFFGHLRVMHVLKVSLHNCRNYEFLVIKEIITLTLDSVCIQATESVDIVDHVFFFPADFLFKWIYPADSESYFPSAEEA